MSRSETPNCWVDTFELSRYRGRRRRLFGPANFVALRSRSEPWGISLDSMNVGSQAYVRLYKSHDLATTVLWLLPDQNVPDVIEYKIEEDVDSLQILDRAPTQGEPGFEAFIKQIKK